MIASLSLGETATFQMRKMTNVWPCSGTPNGGVDASELVQDYPVGHGDLLVMLGKTQDHWHHRVPKEKGRRPRLNINFRYIVGGTKGFDIILDSIARISQPCTTPPAACGVIYLVATYAWDADWGLRSDVMTNSRVQARAQRPRPSAGRGKRRTTSTW